MPAHFDDGGYSGANLQRPALMRLRERIEAGEVDAVVVYKIDRLAPQIQEEVLFLPAQSSGRDTITERALRSLVAEPDWRVQRRLWRRIRRHAYKSCNKQGASLPSVGYPDKPDTPPAFATRSPEFS